MLHTSNEHLYNVHEYGKSKTLINSWMWMYYVKPTKSFYFKMLNQLYTNLKKALHLQCCVIQLKS